jgi:hypothetical protein
VGQEKSRRQLALNDELFYKGDETRKGQSGTERDSVSSNEIPLCP